MPWAQLGIGNPQRKSGGLRRSDISAHALTFINAFARYEVDHFDFPRRSIDVEQAVARNQLVPPPVFIEEQNWKIVLAGGEHAIGLVIKAGGQRRVQVPHYMKGRVWVVEAVDDTMAAEIASVHVCERVRVEVEISEGRGGGKRFSDTVGDPIVIALAVARVP